MCVCVIRIFIVMTSLWCIACLKFHLSHTMALTYYLKIGFKERFFINAHVHNCYTHILTETVINLNTQPNDLSMSGCVAKMHLLHRYGL